MILIVTINDEKFNYSVSINEKIVKANRNPKVKEEIISEKKSKIYMKRVKKIQICRKKKLLKMNWIWKKKPKELKNQTKLLQLPKIDQYT